MLSWSIVSWNFVGGLAAICLAAWTGWRVLHKRRRRSLAVVTLAAAVLLSSAGAADAVNAYFSYLPQAGDVVNAVDGERSWPSFSSVTSLSPSAAARRWPHGVVTHFPVPDRGSGFGRTGALVYLPPQYFTSPTRRFPVVYLLHGSPGVPSDWFRGGRAGQLGSSLAASGKPVIIVSPRMSQRWLDDSECVDSPREKAETHLLTDVLPAVDSALRTVRSRDARLIGGMSAGGYCALNLGLRHRDVFGTVVAMSGDVHPTYSPSLTALFGPRADADIAANSPDVYAPSLPAAPGMRVWLDCGDGDRALLAGLTAIAPVLRSRGLTVELHHRPGGHTFHVWQPALVDALTWAAPTLEAAT